MIFSKSIRLLLAIFLFATFVSYAQQTSVMIRAKAKDAKFIGSSIGGAKILVSDAQTGVILAEGITSGSTGNTDLIMKTAHERGQSLSEESTAGFLATLDLETPVLAQIDVYAPWNKKQAQVHASTQTWILPGKDILGDGIVVEIPGFVIDILAPQTHERLASEVFEVKANIVMMCGCPVEENGLWNASNYQIRAVALQDGKKVKEIDLQQTEKSSTFSGNMQLEKGLYEIQVYAFDPETGNTGLDRTNILIN
ncbi:MAG: hypothetical protein ABGW91_01170 [Christiangramia sp.]